LAEMGKLMVELFGSERLAILEALEGQARRYTDLAKTLKASEGELSRNLNRLADAGLVSKRADGAFQRTPLASTLLTYVPNLRFLAEHSEYVRTHAFHELPSFALQNIHALGRAEFRSDLMPILDGITTVFRTVKKRFLTQWIIGETVWDERQAVRQDELARNIIDNDAEVRAVVLKEELPLYDNLPAEVLVRMQTRVVPSAAASIAMSDTHAFVNFNGLDGRIDNNFAFFGSDPAFMAWVEALVEDGWRRGTPHQGFAAARRTKKSDPVPRTGPMRRKA
jgi:predicted transcriptional regulator